MEDAYYDPTPPGTAYCIEAGSGELYPCWGPTSNFYDWSSSRPGDIGMVVVSRGGQGGPIAITDQSCADNIPAACYAPSE